MMNVIMSNALDNVVIHTGKSCVTWNGDNLKEVIDFIGKYKKFDQWFNSWEEYENYVYSHDNILKMFISDREYYEVYVGCEIERQWDGSWKPITKEKYKYILK